MKIKNAIASIAFAAAALIGLVTGCTTVPTVESVGKTAKSLGIVCGYACQTTSMKPEVKTIIVDVLDVASSVIPATNQTYTAAWTPTITNGVNVAVTARKISAAEGVVAMTALTAITKGIDFMFNRHPQWKEHQTLADSAIINFSLGFRKVIEMTTLSSTNKLEEGVDETDVEAYCKYLSTAK